MKIVRVLLASSDRRLTNAIEIAVRHACFEQRQVECASTRRLDELVHRGTSDEFGLICIAPVHLVTGPPTRSRPVSMVEIVEALRMVKVRRAVPIIAASVAPQEQQPLLEVGVDAAFGVLFNREDMSSEVRRVLHLHEAVGQERSESIRWSLTASLWRGFQRLRQT